MNGSRKWHKANGPAFAPGEKWLAIDGSGECHIVTVRKFGTKKWDYEVSYLHNNGNTYNNDAWHFQVRYQHVADQHI